jgi:hypothetical protein
MIAEKKSPNDDSSDNGEYKPGKVLSLNAGDDSSDEDLVIDLSANPNKKPIEETDMKNILGYLN